MFRINVFFVRDGEEVYLNNFESKTSEKIANLSDLKNRINTDQFKEYRSKIDSPDKMVLYSKKQLLKLMEVVRD